MNKKLSHSIYVLCFFLLFTACTKDTDFGRTEEIKLSPVIELNAIYFELPATRFFDPINLNPILTVKDTTDIKFLDDSTLRKHLKRAEFYFKFTNSIPENFQVDFHFLSQTNDTTYVAGTSVFAGTTNTPVVTEYFQNLAGEDIPRLTQANKVVVTVTIASFNQNWEGTLNLKSKTTYFLEN